MPLSAILLVPSRTDRCAVIGSALAGDISSAIASKLTSYNGISPTDGNILLNRPSQYPMADCASMVLLRLVLLLVIAPVASGAAGGETQDAVGAPKSAEPVSAPSATPTAPPAEKPAAPKPHPILSSRLTSEVASILPVWTPPAPDAPAKPPPPPPDPDVVRMAPVIVTSSQLPRIDEKEWLTPKALDDVLIKEYIAPFDRYFLSRFTLPLFGIPQAERARMIYAEEKRLRDMKWMDDEIAMFAKPDAAAAKDLKKIRNDLYTRASP